MYYDKPYKDLNDYLASTVKLGYISLPLDFILLVGGIINTRFIK